MPVPVRVCVKFSFSYLIFFFFLNMLLWIDQWGCVSPWNDLPSITVWSLTNTEITLAVHTRRNSVPKTCYLDTMSFFSFIVSRLSNSRRELIDRVRKSVVVAVVREWLFFVTSVICVWTRSCRSEVMTIPYHFDSDFGLQWCFYQIGFVVLFLSYLSRNIKQAWHLRHRSNSMLSWIWWL